MKIISEHVNYLIPEPIFLLLFLAMGEAVSEWSACGHGESMDLGSSPTKIH